jgi:nicotinamide-nucleotide amidase
MDETLYPLAARLGQALQAARLQMAAAESCTGGWIGQAMTMVPGSSAWFERGYVTYSNRAKQEVLGVRAETLARHGAVSEETVREMVLGTLAAAPVDLAVAVSGIAGPDGGHPGKPVGTVCLGWGRRGQLPRCTTVHLAGDRDAVRRQTVVLALQGLLDLLPD